MTALIAFTASSPGSAPMTPWYRTGNCQYQQKTTLEREA